MNEITLALKTAKTTIDRVDGQVPIATGKVRLHLMSFAGFVLLLAGIYGSTFRTQVPLYLSNARALDALETLLPSIW